MSDRHPEISEDRLLFFEKQEVIVNDFDSPGYIHIPPRVNSPPLKRALSKASNISVWETIKYAVGTVGIII